MEGKHGGKWFTRKYPGGATTTIVYHCTYLVLKYYGVSWCTLVLWCTKILCQAIPRRSHCYCLPDTLYLLCTYGVPIGLGTMVHRCSFIVFQAIPGRGYYHGSLVFLWCTVVLWWTVVLWCTYGVLWFTMLYYDVPMVCYGLLWCTMMYYGVVQGATAVYSLSTWCSWVLPYASITQTIFWKSRCFYHLFVTIIQTIICKKNHIFLNNIYIHTGSMAL